MYIGCTPVSRQWTKSGVVSGRPKVFFIYNFWRLLVPPPSITPSCRIKQSYIAIERNAYSVHNIFWCVLQLQAPTHIFAQSTILNEGTISTSYNLHYFGKYTDWITNLTLNCANTVDKVLFNLSPATGGMEFNIQTLLCLIVSIEQYSPTRL